MHLEENNLLYYEKMRREYEDIFRAIVKRGIRNGEIKTFDVEIIVFSTLSTLRTLYLWYPKQRKINPELLKHDMISVLLKGLV